MTDPQTDMADLRAIVDAAEKNAPASSAHMLHIALAAVRASAGLDQAPRNGTALLDITDSLDATAASAGDLPDGHSTPYIETAWARAARRVFGLHAPDGLMATFVGHARDELVSIDDAWGVSPRLVAPQLVTDKRCAVAICRDLFAVAAVVVPVIVTDSFVDAVDPFRLVRDLLDACPGMPAACDALEWLDSFLCRGLSEYGDFVLTLDQADRARDALHGVRPVCLRAEFVRDAGGVRTTPCARAPRPPGFLRDNVHAVADMTYARCVVDQWNDHMSAARVAWADRIGMCLFAACLARTGLYDAMREAARRCDPDHDAGALAVTAMDIALHDAIDAVRLVAPGARGCADRTEPPGPHATELVATMATNIARHVWAQRSRRRVGELADQLGVVAIQLSDAVAAAVASGFIRTIEHVVDAARTELHEMHRVVRGLVAGEAANPPLPAPVATDDEQAAVRLFARCIANPDISGDDARRATAVYTRVCETAVAAEAHRCADEWRRDERVWMSVNAIDSVGRLVTDVASAMRARPPCDVHEAVMARMPAKVAARDALAASLGAACTTECRASINRTRTMGDIALFIDRFIDSVAKGWTPRSGYD